MRHCLRALLIAAPLLAAGAASAETTGTLTLVASAQTLSGIPLAEVRLRLPDGGDLLTNQRGIARLVFPASQRDTPPAVTLGDDRYRLAAVQSRTTASGDHYQFFQVYDADPAKMSAEDRAAYARMLPVFLANERAAAERDLPGEPQEATALRLSAFLEGSRVEDPAAATANPSPHVVPPDLDPKANVEPAVEVQVVAQDGLPVANRPVLLFGQTGEDGATLAVLGSDTTNASGVVRFIRLPQNRFLRLEVPSQTDGLQARSPIFLYPRPGTLKLPALVLREPARTLSGVVLFGGKPLPGAHVRLNDSSAPLATSTDMYGYFELAPVPPRAGTVTITRQSTQATADVRPGPDEMILPVDMLAGR